VTPVPLDLPLRPPEAAELANVVFSLAERKPLNDEVRGRVASRLAAVRFESLRPYALSLDRDPVHHSTYYMAIDGQSSEPLLLHMAPAAAPTSAIFPKPLLIGRMRQANGPEMILNAIPFGPADQENIERFAAEIDQAFLPRAQASRPAVVAGATPAAFEAFRRIFKSSRKNIAAIEAQPGESPRSFYYAGIWAAIRSGWREGYTAGVSLAVDTADGDSLRDTIAEAAPLTRFAVNVSSLIGTRAPAAELPAFDTGPDWEFSRAELSTLATKYAAPVKAAERAHELIRQARAAQKITRPFDFELSLENAPEPTSPQELIFCLGWLKARGHAAQLVAPRIGGGSDLTALAAAARFAQCTLTLDAESTDLGAIARATAGRVNLRLQSGDIAETAAELFG
jgi:hypothetical protein